MLEEVDEEIEKEHCAVCDELIDECQCEMLPKCPFCGDEADMGGEISLEHFGCEHFIAGWDDGGFCKLPVRQTDLPVLPNKPENIEWSPEKLKEIFGEAELLLDAYSEVFTDEPDGKEFMEILSEMIPEIDKQSYYDQNSASMLGWEADMYFAKNPDATRKRVAELIEKLRKGFEYLENSSGDSK